MAVQGHGFGENCVEWLRGCDRMWLTLSEPEMVRKVCKMAETDKNIQVISKAKNYVYANMPTSYLRIKAPTKRNVKRKVG